MRGTGGWGATATDDGRILRAISLLARTEGIFTEPAGGATLAATIRLIDDGVIAKDESIVVCITGNGYKTSDVMGDTVQRPTYLGRSLKEFEAFLADRHERHQASERLRCHANLSSPRSWKRKGHLIDSQLLNSIFDKVIERGGKFEVLEFDIGRTNEEFSHLKLNVTVDDQAALRHLLEDLIPLGCHPPAETGRRIKAGAGRRGCA